MNSNQRLFAAFRFLALGTLITCFFAGTASAEPARLYQGNFTLPFHARLGGKVLEAGEYSITLDRARSKSLITVRVENGAASLVLRSIARRSSVGQNMLVLKRDGSMRTISAIYVAELGVILYFEGDGQQLPRDPARMERVPIRSVPWGACPEYCLG